MGCTIKPCMIRNDSRPDIRINQSAICFVITIRILESNLYVRELLFKLHDTRGINGYLQQLAWSLAPPCEEGHGLFIRLAP